MTSCPSEEELVLFVEDGLPSEEIDAVADHLVACAACRRLVARSEAALRYALAGIAGREQVVPVAVARPAPVRRTTWRRAAAAGLATAAAAAAVLVVVNTMQTQAPDAPGLQPRDVASRPAPTLADDIDALLARVERLATPDPVERDSDIALAALAAAEARIDLGMATGEARLRDVTERFAGTSAAREARARLASLGAGRSR